MGRGGLSADSGPDLHRAFAPQLDGLRFLEGDRTHSRASDPCPHPAVHGLHALRHDEMQENIGLGVKAGGGLLRPARKRVRSCGAVRGPTT